MKKIILVICFLFLGLNSFATEGTQTEALNFFKSYINAANSYSPALLSMYSNNAKIIRQVIKPNGHLVNVPFSINDYRKQMTISSKVAKMRNYKNYYSNIVASEVPNGFKITSNRKPSMSKNDSLKTTMVVQKQKNGKWLIVEETMQTREQIFLKYAKK